MVCHITDRCLTSLVLDLPFSKSANKHTYLLKPLSLSVLVPGNTISFSTLELLIANINWYCRLLPEEHIYGQGTAVDVILAVRHCLYFIWTFSCLSFLVLYVFSSPSLLFCVITKRVITPPPLVFSSRLLLVDFAVYVSTPSFISSYTDRGEKWGKTFYSTLFIVGLGMCACFWHKAEIRKYVRRGVREPLCWWSCV